jgi:hypothetical protein
MRLTIVVALPLVLGIGIGIAEAADSTRLAETGGSCWATLIAAESQLIASSTPAT